MSITASRAALSEESFNIDEGNGVLNRSSCYLNNLLYENKILLYRGLSLTPDMLAKFARNFGELEKSEPIEFSADGQPFVGVLSNASIDNKPVGFSSAGRYWHTDGYYLKEPVKATLLYCVEAPTRGGETMFVDACGAYNDLPCGMKQRIRRLKGYCPFFEIYRESMRRRGLLELTDEQSARYCDVSHPIVRTHPITGKRSLYLNEHYLGYIDGICRSESDRILKFLYRFATDSARVYSHKWRPGDLLIWDNASLLHKAVKPFNGSIKTMLRCTTKGGIPY